MSSENVLELKQISKCYRLYNKPQDRLKQMIFRGRHQYFTEFWALKDVSLTVKKGACVGIIGRNGAGKSTLLQIISNIITPTSGEMIVSGRVAALLELGTGFNPEFTGHENVFLNGSILGLTQEEIRTRYESIVSFADIGNFIHQPVKTYSSGMLVRLAFAVAIHVDPEILIVDEALSVGDAKFQAKCFRKFQDFRDQQKTILFVTHATEQVIRHCDDVYLIENGQVLDRGDPRKVTHKYLSLLFETSPVEKNEKSDNATEVDVLDQPNDNEKQDELAIFLSEKVIADKVPSRPGYNKAEYRWGSRDAEILDVLLSSEKHWHINHFKASNTITIYMKVRFNRSTSQPIYGLTVKTPDGVTVYGTNSRDLNQSNPYNSQKAGDIITVSFSLSPRLTSGHYLLSLGIVEEGPEDVLPLDRRYDVFEIYITNEHRVYGIADLGMTFSKIAANS